MTVREPTLPPELEREIFTLAAQSDGLQRRHLPSLILVARRVQIWCSALSFLLCYSSWGMRSLHRTNSEFRQFLIPGHTPVAQHVRNSGIGTWSDACDLVDCIHVCSGTTKLALFTSTVADCTVPGLSEALAELPLKELTAPLVSIFPDHNFDFGHRLFSQITHLHIQDRNPHDWSGLAELPFLTHLAFTYPQPASILDTILAECKFLQALVYNAYIPPGSTCPYFLLDPRTVVFGKLNYRDDWEVAVTGGEDYWARVDKYLQRRRNGEIPENEYVISD
ncbi:hypothetical protein C8R46DRAFT_1286257 [Mycena filopes]|nr:hypothetical protein C8R46DRAFT_1286257 [Mycena filopes]